MHQNQQYHSGFSVTSVTSHTSHMKSHIQEFIISILRRPIFHSSHSVTSEKSQLRSPIIRSIIYQAISSARHGRHLYITSWAHCAVFYFYRPPPDLQWTQLCDFQNRNRKPVLAFPKTEKPVLQRVPGFGNPNPQLSLLMKCDIFRFSSLTLLDRQQEGHLACKKKLNFVCWWWRFDWSFAHLIAPVVTTTSIILSLTA